MKHIDLYESKQHGTKEFPIAFYEVNSYHPQYVMQPHWHNEFEIIRIVSGNFDLYINNTFSTLNPGDIAFINCKELHRGTPHNCEYECIVVNFQIFKNLQDIYISYIEPLLLGNFTVINSKNSNIYAAAEKLFNAMKLKKPFFKLNVMSYIYNIVFLFYTEELVKENNVPKKMLNQSSVITQLIDWIDNNYTENISLSLLADKAGLSQSYLCRIFKEYTGKSPIEYINAVRIENICLQITEGEKNITAIALNNGYNDISYFCKAFKKITGVSAKEYSKGIMENTKGF